ncbi:hypothetical protein [Tenacibaculum sp. Bg11-29]|uniref:hypothetical protein n=1 Tax=Tenacibaculum sp. Bg11-29 TaxID=2058306 RepID=UPI0012FEF497|nr:hypothetical protein [Tenacibaculum sp. Bg11-29]
MKTLKLFNAVIANNTNETSLTKCFISENGFIIEKNAMWAKEGILNYFENEKLTGEALNKTFHKSWERIKESTRFELYVEQIQHYISTYVTVFKAEVYIPNEVLNIPDLKIKYKVIKAYSIEEMRAKCLSLLQSGIALKEETIADVLSILVDELKYVFTGKENIRNKEALVIIADTYKIYPENVVEFFRYIIYKTTDSTLVIKSNDLIEEIKNSTYNPTIAFREFGLEKLAEIFNRFKPLFLAYKNSASKVINRISKLSKKYHKPLIINPLNEVTNVLLTESDIHWLDNATPFALFKALSACYTRKKGQDTFLYRIRNGKSWVKLNAVNYVNEVNYSFLIRYLQKRVNLSGKKIFLPKNINYALPTSEKMFVGNIPTGTKFYGKKLAIGIYWKDAWGADDLDLSGLNIGGKIGWNSTYNQEESNLMYSGDITSAPNGAVEYLYANKGLNAPTLINSNVYSGESDCDYKIVIGKGDSISKDFMMNPNNLFTEIKCKSIQQQTILGILIPKKEKQCFVLLNFGAGHTRVSGTSEISNLATKALYQQWNKPLSFKKIIKELGGEIVKKSVEADYDFSLDTLQKDSFISIFK